MGKESRLRNPRPDETRHAYANGNRKLYDRDRMPDGLDSDIWQAALYFEQKAEQNGQSVPGRPVIYTEMYHRVARDRDLSNILDQDSNSLARARTTGICGIDLLMSMIDYYWDCYYVDSNHNINHFCSITVFTDIKDIVLFNDNFDRFIATADRVRQKERMIKKPATVHVDSSMTTEEIRGKIVNWMKQLTEGEQ